MNNAVKNTLALGGGIAVGFVSGFFGGGGGMLCVPLLRARGLDAKSAHATALFVILPICIISAAIYIAHGYFDINSVLCACIGVALGGFAGAAALDKLNNAAVTIIFAFLMIAVGIKSVMP